MPDGYAFDLPAVRPVATRQDPWAADLKPFRPYVYRGLGYDIYEDLSDTENIAWGKENGWIREVRDAD